MADKESALIREMLWTLQAQKKTLDIRIRDCGQLLVALESDRAGLIHEIKDLKRCLTVSDAKEEK